MARDRFRFQIRYGQMRCTRCDEVRVLGQPCHSCGLRPDEREIDPNRGAVRRVAEEALSALRSGPRPATTSPDPIVVWDFIHDRTTAAMEAMAAAFADPTKSPSLRSAALALAQARSDIANAPRLRPWLGLWDAATDVVQRASDAVEAFLETQLQAVPIEAQRLAARAQAKLDEAADPAEPATAALVWAARIAEADTVGDALVQMGLQLFEDAEATSLTELDRENWSLADRIAGSSREWAPGVGVGVAQLRGDVVGRGNEERFWQEARRTFGIVTGCHDVVNIMSTQPWTDDLRHLLLRAHDAAVGVRGMLASAGHQRQEVDALLTATHSMIEGPAKYLLALVLACSTGQSYTDLRLLDASELIRRCSQAGLGGLLEGLEPTLRVAEAHDEFRVVGGRIHFTARTAGYGDLSVQELVDKVLAAEESITAILAGVYVGSQTVGVPGPSISVQDLGLEVLPVIETYMAMGGYPVTKASLENDRLSIGTTSPVTSRSLAQVSALLPFLPDEYGEVALRDDSGTELRGPVSLLREAASTQDEFTKTLREWTAFRAWMIDGQPLVGPDQMRKLVAVTALQLTPSDLSLRDKVARLRALREVVADDVPLAESLSACITILREEGLGARPETSSMISRLVEYAKLEVDSPF